MSEFYGTVKFTPAFAKCNPLYIRGHWTKKDVGKPYLVWCNDGLYKSGINERFIEVVEIESPGHYSQ